MNAHARAHAHEIERRFGQGTATTGQILLFGLTGGLIPCPASITVLLLCLQLDRVALGATLVLGFSIGLAITLVAAGLVAAIGLRRVSRGRPGLERWLRHAPLASSLLILVLALAMAAHALAGWKAT